MKQKTISDVVSPKEAEGLLSIIALNKLLPKEEIVKKWAILGIEVKFRWRSKNNLWGRFGGGWNWAFGFQASGKTIHLMLLICTLTFRKQHPKGE